MKFDPLYYRYPSKRNVIYSSRGMVASSQPLASQAGLEVLKKGGNAIDAAIATASCLTVVEPTSNGIGGDAFALVWTGGKLYGLNSSGYAPAGITLEKIKEAGYDKMPTYGWLPVTVPGVPGAWSTLSKRFGKLPLKEVLEPAVSYASGGYPVSPTVSQNWRKAFNSYTKYLNGDEFKHWFETFAPKGRAPYPGEIVTLPNHAKTLSQIGETKGEAFYHGEIADKIDDFSRQYGGFIRKSDLEGFTPEWVEPIKVNYRGYDVWELPPNGQGLVALIALNILNGFEFNDRENPDTFHKQIEAIKLAFADGLKFISDRESMGINVDRLLSEEYGNIRRKLIGNEAIIPEAGEPENGGTVYLAAADGEGNMVSYIQSNYMGFGSGLVVPGTGISLQNRGCNFSFDPNHANCIKPLKRPYHTIIPGFLTKNNKAVGPFGVMGGFMQPQGHLQVIMNTIDFHMNPQDALNAPRWQWIRDKRVLVEDGFSADAALKLSRMGHDISKEIDSTSFGRGQIIWRTDDGVLVGGTEPRADGSIAVF